MPHSKKISILKVFKLFKNNKTVNKCMSVILIRIFYVKIIIIKMAKLNTV